MLVSKRFIKKYQINNLDLVFIDAEGYDGDIVISFLDCIDFHPIIIFEFIHIEYNIFLNVIKLMYLSFHLSYI